MGGSLVQGRREERKKQERKTERVRAKESMREWTTRERQKERVQDPQSRVIRNEKLGRGKPVSCGNLG